MPRVYVVTLYSGENELAACVDSVSRQCGVEVVHEIIRDLPNQLAHQELYKRFEQRRIEFDFLAKLDADMAFSSERSLKDILSHFVDGVDIVSVTVWDRITDSDMQSFNVFSKSCCFEFERNDPLFPDKLPIHYRGRHVSVVDHGRNVLHAFDPTDYQAFCFGVHRSLKIMQFGQPIPRIDNAYYQWRFIRRAYDNFLRSGATAAYFASLGAAAVLRGEIRDAEMRSKNDYQRAFERCSSERNLEPLASIAGNGNALPLVSLFGAGTVVVALCQYLVRKAQSRLRTFRHKVLPN